MVDVHPFAYIRKPVDEKKFICSVHAESLDELYMKKNMLPLIENGVFDKFVLLENNQDNYYIKEILNV